MTILDELSDLSRGRPAQLEKLKKDGVKLVGYVGRFIPEELIYASGAAPYLMCRGGEPEPPEAVLPYMLRFMSPYARAQFGYYLLNLDPVIPLLDLIVIQSLDCHEARLADLFEYFKLPTMRLGIPPDWQKQISANYYYRGLSKLKDRLEGLTGSRTTDARLKESIVSLNRIRNVLASINLLRKRQPPPIGGHDFIRLNHYSFYGDLDVIAGKMDTLYQQLAGAKSPFDRTAPRIMLMGHVIATGDYVLPRLIEESGGVIVTEFLDEGIRHCSPEIATDGDLMKTLGETYYLRQPPPSSYQPVWANRLIRLKDMIKEFNVQGVILYQLFMEEIYDYENSLVQRAMSDMGVPCLKLESSYEYSRESMGPLTTKVESFIESLRRS